MDVVVCLLCGEEPFLCPERFRRTHMDLHLRQAHSFGDVTLLPQWRGEHQFYSEGRGRHAQPVLRVVSLVMDELRE